MRNIYEIGKVQFWHNGGGAWHFRAPMPEDPAKRFVKIVHMSGGKSAAEPVATAINASVTRTDKRVNKPELPIDGLCRNRLNQLGVA